MKGSVLDIGAGRNPYFIRYRIPQVADAYTALDSCQQCLDENRDLTGLWGKQYPVPRSLSFVKANAAALPFDDASFDAAVMSNLLSAPIHKEWHKEPESPAHVARGLGANDPFYMQRARAVAEALRVLRPGGRLLIYTDIIIYGQHAYNAVLMELRQNPRLEFRTLEDEQLRVDALNLENTASGTQCHCFLAEVLPASSVYEITKVR